MAARILLSVLLSLLLWMYPLFLLTLAVGVGAVLVWLVVVAAHVNWHLAIAAVIPLCLHLAALAQLLMAYGLVRELPKSSGDDELPLPRSQLKPLYSLVKRVAGARHVGMPDEIRLAADTVAHVYEDDGGREILVLGGFALASFSEETLEGIIAHELCHFAAGDTRQSRRWHRRAAYMQMLNYTLRQQAATALNPLTWLVQAYHLLFWIAWAAQSRRQEIRADQQEVKQVGEKKAARSLLYVTVIDALPAVRLSAIAESFVSTNQPLDAIFAEQVRRLRSISDSDWADACRGELRRNTRLFDTHPALRDRLAAMGISRRQAVKLKLERTDEPTSRLLPEWKSIEGTMTQWILARHHVEYQAKMDHASIVLGRPARTR